MDAGIAVLQVCLAQSKRFHFRSQQHHADLEFLDDEIVVTGFSVLTDDFVDDAPSRR